MLPLFEDGTSELEQDQVLLDQLELCLREEDSFL
jgi:hypothetical protein